MFMPAARLGLHYYAGGMRRYVSRLGLNAAKTLFLTAAKLDSGGAAADRLPDRAGAGRAADAAGR